MNKSLFIIRTPLQAWSALQLIENLSIKNFDVLYLYEFESRENQHYFSQLKLNADRACLFDISNKECGRLRHIKYYIKMYVFANEWISNQNYKSLYAGSLNNFIFQLIHKKLKNTKLYTFDDGTANFYKSSIYYISNDTIKKRLFKFFAGCSSLEEIKKTIIFHYSLHPQISNVVPFDRIRPLYLSSQTGDIFDKNRNITYFIGQPFEMDIKHQDILRFKACVEQLSHYDYYVMHPDEKEPLLSSVPILEKNGLIGEEAILKNGDKKNIQVIGNFSTLLFNLPIPAENKKMILVKGQQFVNELALLAKQAGIQVTII